MAKPLAIIAALLMPGQAFAGSNPCRNHAVTPEITFRILDPEPEYRQVTSEEIRTAAGLRNPSHTLGFTAADFNIFTAFTSQSFELDPSPPTPYAPYSPAFNLASSSGRCVAITKIEFEIGYASINVLIDDKFRPGACRHTEILKHENVHVGIYRDILRRYAPLVRTELEDMAYSIKPMFEERRDTRTIDRIFNENIDKNPRLQAIIARMMREIQTRNNEYDSDDEYERLAKACK